MSSRIVIHRHTFPDLIGIRLRDEARERRQLQKEYEEMFQHDQVIMRVIPVEATPQDPRDAEKMGRANWAKDFIQNVTPEKVAHLKGCKTCREVLMVAQKENNLDIGPELRDVLGMRSN